MANNSNRNQSGSFKAALAIFLFKLTATLPRVITDALAFLIGYLSFKLSGKTRHIIRTNLKICYPDLNQNALEVLVKKNMMENAKLALEFPTAWLANKEKIKSLLTKVNNQNLVDGALAKKQPLIIAVPHIGNWEFFWHWMQLNFPTIGMYSPADIPEIDKLMLTSRQRFGGQPFATDPKGIMSLLKALKKGNVLMILPDQVPRKDAGIYTPFFGQSAYTMTLLHRFVQKTGANLLFGSCLRDKVTHGFNIDLQAANFDISTEKAEDFNLGMNRQIESIVNQAPEQYQWSYKRFKRQQNNINLYKT